MLSFSVAPRRTPTSPLFPYTTLFRSNHSADLLSTSEADLINTTKATQKIAAAVMKATNAAGVNVTTNNGAAAGQVIFQDRKSTRLNSSHQIISYAVFCLKKKTQ